MSLAPLTIIPAGAGSGKTHTIQQRLSDWVKEGLVAPEKIVAVTFTEAAASELSERIRKALLNSDMLDEALRIDQAYISTIHGFGLRLLTEFAFDAGLSPKPRRLNEDEENTLIRLALARTEKTDVVTSNLSNFGYRYSFGAVSAEEVFRNDLLDIVHLLRSAGWQAGRGAFVNNTAQSIRDRYGQTVDAVEMTNQLHTHVLQLLEVYPESLARNYKSNKAAYKDLKKDFQSLKDAYKLGALQNDWNLWQSLRTLRQSNKRCKLPDDYDELTSAIMRTAEELLHHPGPLDHAITHITAMLEGGQDVLAHYAEDKRKAGLVDYSDMIALADQMLRKQPSVLEALVRRIDCLVVDEFQDTNPLQFSLLWQLKEAGVPALIVGDLKQAIMGFQGADPRLFEQLEQQHQNESEPLDRNWRSQPMIMQFVNTIGPGLFGENYTSLEPQSEETNIVPLEAIIISARAKGDQHKIRAHALGGRLQALLNDPDLTIKDQRTDETRRLRGGDIAVLCPTHNVLSEYALVFRAMGLRVRLQEEGWYSSRIVQIIWHALAYVSNPNDRHAALYLTVTELGSLSLEEALSQLMDQDSIADPILTKLDEIASQVMDRTVYALIDHVIDALDVFDEISTWPNSEQARANLLRMLAEASEFMEANREALASGGFYGSGLQSFLSWLTQKTESKDANKQPKAKVLDEEAIELVTWHSSKGREWPIVAVCELEHKIKANLPDKSIGYRSFDDLNQVLNNATIEYAPEFAAPEKKDRFIAPLQTERELEARRLLYVAMTRAREKLILEWPSYSRSSKVTSYWSLLKENTGLSLKDDHWQMGDTTFPCIVTQGDVELPEHFEIENQLLQDILPTFGRRAIQEYKYTGKLTPDSVSPSTLKVKEEDKSEVSLQVEKYSDALTIDIGLTRTARGTFLHQCFEYLSTSPDSESRIAMLTGFEPNKEVMLSISKQVASFEKWLEQYFSPKSIARELPLLALDENKSVISGSADLLIETKDGAWVIDHKSDLVDDMETAFGYYKPQLDAYVDAIAQSGTNVVGIGINWMTKGVVTLSSLCNQ